MAKNRRHMPKDREESKVKKIKFDVIKDEIFIKTFTMEYLGDFIPLGSMKEYVEEKMPITLRGKAYEIYVHEKNSNNFA